MIKSSKSGFTLIEIILSIAILAILSVGFFGAFSVVFINTYRTGELTEAMFAAQGEVEDLILEIKTKLKDDQDVSEYEPDTITIFDSYGSSISRDVIVYPIKLETPSISISTFVSRTRAPKLIVPKIEGGITITAKIGNNTVSYPNIATDNLSVEVQTPVIDKPGYLIQHLYYWYRSPLNQYTPSFPPVFPDSYELIPQYTTKNIPVFDSSFGGRIVRALVTPVGEKGQVGTSVVSNPILMSKMPVNDRLLLHMDASFITHSSGSEMHIDSQRVKQWKDISPTVVTSSTTANENSSPQLIQELLGENSDRRIFSIQKNTTSTTQSLIATNTLDSRGQFVLYIAYRFYVVPEGGDPNLPRDSNLLTTNFNNPNNILLIDIKDGNLQFSRMGNNRPSPIAYTPDKYRTGDWAIYKVEVSPTSLKVSTNLTLSEAGVLSFDPLLTYTSTNNSNSTGVSLRGLRSSFPYGHNLGEIIVFDDSTSSHNSSGDSLKIMRYLYDKYISNQ